MDDPHPVVHFEKIERMLSKSSVRIEGEKVEEKENGREKEREGPCPEGKETKGQTSATRQHHEQPFE